MRPIQMVDLHQQYQNIKTEVDQAIQQVISDSAFIGGKYVNEFANSLKTYLNINEVIPCGNGTDALQLALMALDLNQGDEVIVPDFCFVAPAEAVALLGLKPVFAKVDETSFNLTEKTIAAQITPKTKAIIVVHLFGQPANMEAIMQLAKKHGLKVIEDVAQAFGAQVSYQGKLFYAGTIGDLGCTSFFPSKNLACFGDGGAVYTNNAHLANQIRMLANHGQPKKYTHTLIGINSRLDGLQAAILNVKLKYLPAYLSARQYAAKFYDEHLGMLSWLTVPKCSHHTNHSYNQYTIQLIKGVEREALIQYLMQKNIPSMVYYASPISRQSAYKEYAVVNFDETQVLCDRVLSLPIHTEMDEEQLLYICNAIKSFHG